mgnify:FL=1|jgi:7-cyano-7-deazaguanine reductase
MKVIKKVKYLGKTTKINESPDNFKLDSVKNPHSDRNYAIRFVSPEFTSICPITSQPDFAKIIIDYVPNKLIMESKSFKLFLVTFRNYGAFHEDCTIKIAKKIEKSIKPKWIRVCSFWNPRGGIPIDVFYQSGKKPKEIFIEELKIETYSSR